jgi:hypothetical protein
MAARQINCDRRSLPWRAFDLDASTVPLDDLGTGREPEARATSRRFGREVGLEGARLGYAIHAHASVADRQLDIGIRLPVRWRGALGILADIRCRDPQLPPSRHGVARIQRHIQHDLLQLC